MADKLGAVVRPIIAGPALAGRQFIELLSSWFSPQQPVTPQAPIGTPPRERDYPVGYNIQYQPRGEEEITFGQLRDLARLWDLLALVIETRKDQVASVPWTIRPKALPGESRLEYKQRADTVPGIEKVTAALHRPDGQLLWHPWIRKLVHEHLVIDAICVLPRRAEGRMMLDVIDGATVKILIDSEGRRPQPPSKAYQQVLKGIPAIDFTIEELRYYMRSPRADRIYGYSPVEQIITTVNIAMRRQQFQLNYYTEGNIPEALIGTPQGWTPEQIVAFQTAWDAMFTGNLAQRRHAKFVPGDVGKSFVPTKEPDLKNPMDDWLARIVCFAFSISPQQLMTMMNKATAESSGEQAKEEGIEPTKEYVKEMVDDVIETDFNSADLEMAWDDEQVVDEKTQTEIILMKKDGGLITTRRAQEMLGEEPSDDPGADVLMVKTGTGMVPIGANTVEGKQEAIDAGIVPDPTAPPALPPGAAGGPPGAGKPPAGGKAPPKAAAAPVPKPKAEKLAMARNVMGVFKARGVPEPVPFPFPPNRNGG